MSRQFGKVPLDPVWVPGAMPQRLVFADLAGAVAGAVLAAILVPVIATPVWVNSGTLAAARVFSAVIMLPLAARRRYPVISASSVAIIALAHVAVGFPWLLPADLAVLVALYSVTVYGPKWAARAALPLAIVGAGLTTWRLSRFQAVPNLAAMLTIAALVAAAALVTWALALVRRTHRENIWALQSRAEAMDDRAVMMELRARKAETERDQQAQIAVAAERMRIAREMHDIIGHALTGMVFLANSAEYAATATGDATAAAGALHTISKTGTEALGTMRQLLQVLRDEDGQWREAEVGTPTPGTIGSTGNDDDPSGWRSLIVANRDMGMDLTVTETGQAIPLTPPVANALYRITQEALTNVRKHAGQGARVTIALSWSQSGFRLVITDDGGAQTPQRSPGMALKNGATGTSQGLIGMRERAALAGGELTAGPSKSGWQVVFEVNSLNLKQ